MKQILDFIPLILFFAAYQIWGVQEAALVLVGATVAQLAILKLWLKKLEKSQAVTGAFVIFFGLLTAYFNDVRYLQWKVTLVNLLFAIILVVSQFGFKKPLVKLLLGKELNAPETVWAKLNLGWAGFFVLSALINIIISEYFSEEAWIAFKTFGLIGMTLVALILTMVYLYPYIKQNGEQNGNSTK